MPEKNYMFFSCGIRCYLEEENTTLGLQFAVGLFKINTEPSKPQKDVICSYFLNYLAW